MKSRLHHYARDVAPLLDECIRNLQITIDKDSSGENDGLYELKKVLLACEGHLHHYLIDMLHHERKLIGLDAGKRGRTATGTLMDTLHAIIHLQTSLPPNNAEFSTSSRAPTSPVHCLPEPTRYATDTLLFRLIVSLQLCQLRISDAHNVVAGHHLSTVGEETKDRCSTILSAVCLLGGGIVSSLYSRTRYQRKLGVQDILTGTSFHFLLGFGGAMLVPRFYAVVKKRWIMEKLNKSTTEISEWIEQWQVLEPLKQSKDLDDDNEDDFCATEIDCKATRLIEYALQKTPKSSFWQYSQGEIRFLMLRRFMDVYYASVSTAIDAHQTSMWQLPLATGAAASFYSVIGARKKTSQALNSASKDLGEWYHCPQSRV